MKIDILTLFPGMFAAVTQESLLKRASDNGILNIEVTDIRDYTKDKHKKVDDYPFGGGAGMVLMADPVFNTLEHIGTENKRIIYMSPRGRMLDEELAKDLANESEIVLLCGHYEGIDERIIEHYDIEEVSIGDYVLTGGELPAMVLVDVVSRMIPGVIGNEDAHNEESIYSGLLEYPQYTKPRSYEGMDVPEVLLSGNHKKIKLWNYEKSLILTAQYRPDLFQKYVENAHNLSKEEKKILEKVIEDYISITKID